MKILSTLLLTVLALQFSLAQNGENLYDHSYLHEIRITFTDNNFWQVLNDNYQSGQDPNGGGSGIEYLEGSIDIDGNVLESVGVRLKGFSSFFFTNSDKKSIKIDINEFVDGQKYDGVNKFNLNNGTGDPALMRDVLAYDIIREAGGIAPRTAHAKVYINDTFWGTYVMVEQVNDDMMRRYFAEENGNLFKNISWSEMEYMGSAPDPYKAIFQLKSNELEDDYTGLIELLEVINQLNGDDFKTRIREVFNVEQYLRVLAVDIMTNNWDSYIEHGRNWYLYQEPQSGQFQWVPWDYNLSMGGTFSGGGEPILVDPICPILADFDYVKTDSLVTFTAISNPDDATAWMWDFGDSNTSNEENPVHVFDSIATYQVCLTIERMQDGMICSDEKCRTVSFEPADCLTIDNGSCPYPGDDPVFLEVIALDPFCCEVDWDGICQASYDNISNGGGGGGGGGNPTIGNFQLDYQSNKVLINKILGVPEFRQEFYNIACRMLEDNFTAERLFPIIDENADIIRDAVADEPNSLFTANYFEYDVSDFPIGNNGATIPPLKAFFNERINHLETQLDNLGHDCDGAFNQLGANDVVINELLADHFGSTWDPDPAGEFDDWIELFNNTDEPIDLYGYYLTDDAENQYFWAIPEGTVIEPNGYLTVWADYDIRQEGLHANMHLNKGGESLWLIHGDGSIIDNVTYGEQDENVAYARVPNGTGDFVKQGRTRGYNNEEDPNSVGDIPSDWRVSVFPNPTASQVQIRLDNIPLTADGTITITNQLGQTIRQMPIMTNQQMIDLSKEVSGVYYLKINVDGKTLSERVMKM